MKMNKIENLFKDRAIIKGQTMLFSKKDTIEFIASCKKEGVNILGLDCFLFNSEDSPMSIENSIDFTASYAAKTNIIEQALNFVNSFDERHFFEIVCE